MDTIDRHGGSCKTTPFAAVLGAIYCGKQTGVLEVVDRNGADSVFKFYFKRGFPCHSVSRDGVAPLGEMLGEAKARLILPVLRRQALPAIGGKQLLGQMLLAESMVTGDDLAAALTSQLHKRLVACSARSGLSYTFSEGMSHFARVPLSSPICNPMEAAAVAAGTGPLEAFFPYVAARVPTTHARLAQAKRMPPQVRKHLSPTLMNALLDDVRLDRAMDAPQQLRSLCFLLAFDFLEFVNKMEPASVGDCTPVGTAAAQAATCCRSGEHIGIEPATGAVRTLGEPATGTERTVARLVGCVRTEASCYELLGVPLDAAQAVVKERYRTLALEIHPDRVGPRLSKSAIDVFPHVVDAYHTLSRDRLRTEYDLRLFLSDSWVRLGDAATVAASLANRRSLLAAAGLTNLAREYTRMIASVSFGPDPLLGAGPQLPGQRIVLA